MTWLADDGFWLLTRRKASDATFGFSNRPIVLIYPLGQSPLQLGIRDTQQCSSMTEGELLLLQQSLNLIRQLQNAKIVGDEGSVPTHTLRHFLLGQPQRFD